MFQELFNQLRAEAANDFTMVGLRMAIVVWALFIIVLALTLKNKWVLAGILAYEILP